MRLSLPCPCAHIHMYSVREFLHSKDLDWDLKQVHYVCPFAKYRRWFDLQIFSFGYLVLRCNPLVAPPNSALSPINCGNLLGTKCRVECLNGYEEEQQNPLRECEKSEDDLAYWTGEETNCTGKYLQWMWLSLLSCLYLFLLLASAKNRSYRVHIPSRGISHPKTKPAMHGQLSGTKILKRKKLRRRPTQPATFRFLFGLRHFIPRLTIFTFDLFVNCKP